MTDEQKSMQLLVDRAFEKAAMAKMDLDESRALFESASRRHRIACAELREARAKADVAKAKG